MATERWTPAAAWAEAERLDFGVPWGVCCQVPLESLRSLATHEEAVEFYRRWRGEGAVSRADATNLHR